MGVKDPRKSCKTESRNDLDLLIALHACDEAMRWYNGRESRQAWLDCERSDWLLWVAENLGVDQRLLVHAVCDCAEAILKSNKYSSTIRIPDIVRKRIPWEVVEEAIAEYREARDRRGE